MVYLENEYIKVAFSRDGRKDLRGHRQEQTAKLLLPQHVIKPTLISCLAPGFPERGWTSAPSPATSFLLSNHRRAERGCSKTVWVGELELRDRMRWSVGARCIWQVYLEVLSDEQPHAVPSQCSASSNVAVHTNTTTKSLPPSTQYVTGIPRTARHGHLASAVARVWMRARAGLWKTRQRHVGFRWITIPIPWPATNGKHAARWRGYHMSCRQEVFTSAHSLNQILTVRRDLTSIMVGAYSTNQPDYSGSNP